MRPLFFTNDMPEKIKQFDKTIAFTEQAQKEFGLNIEQSYELLNFVIDEILDGSIEYE